ncbi:MAG: MmcQ/YjbR family DNA-binding protein [Nocardioidaceae bacterium]|nr:MmcQ/YjbR family DNA-binding protein [Nocardioidaceae bacterium]
MTTFAAVETLVSSWPESTSTPSYGGFPALRVNKKLFARLRGEMQDDLDEVTGEPCGEVLMVGVSDLGEKEALLVDDPEAFFTVPHYDGYAGILVRLSRVDEAVLRELLLDAWWRTAPKRAQRAYVEKFGPPAGAQG